MDRRHFLTVLAAACASARTLRTKAPARVGLQLYTLRDAARKDLERTLADVAAIGYTEVELLASMKNFGTPPARLRAMLDRLGLRAPSTHIDATMLGTLDRLFDDAHTLGHEYVVLADLGGRRRSLDDFRYWGDALNRAGEAARKAGLWIGFHDEPQDFVRFGDEYGYDALVVRTDPSLVRLQLDMGNAAMGGRDPLDLMRRYGDRYWSFHVKDAPSLGAAHDAELGKGVVDVRGILALVNRRDEKHFFVEQETYPGDPLDSVRRDYEYMMSHVSSS